MKWCMLNVVVYFYSNLLQILLFTSITFETIFSGCEQNDRIYEQSDIILECDTNLN